MKNQLDLSPGGELYTRAKALLHEAQSMLGRWMSTGERQEFLLARIPELGDLATARALALKVDTA